MGVMFLLTEHVLGVGDWDAVLKLAKFVGVVLAGYVQPPFHFIFATKLISLLLR